MNSHTVFRIAFFVPLILLTGVPADAGEGTVLAGKALVRALQSGGYNIYFRHAQTDWSQDDYIDKVDDWTSCDPSRVRQLADAGRHTSRAIGKAIRALGIPVGRLFASPYCRTVETATLMNLGPVETTTDIMNLRVAGYFGGREAIVNTARQRLGTPPQPGTNTVLVAHGNVARAATNVYPDEAEGAVFSPQGNGRFTFVGRIKPAQWTALAKELAASPN
ncbi:MAG: histidine phosphatase family protein [Gammaproteobacteria bacterium]|nr:histidine phosphatase family protein [Gammaproteobacteria bacterium]